MTERKVEELRQAMVGALGVMEECYNALETADGDDVDEAQRAFEHAESEHTRCVDRFERAQRVFEAKRNAPLAGLADDDAPAAPAARAAAPRVSISKEPMTYEKYGERSYFRDLWQGRVQQEPAALERLKRHQNEMRVERRDLAADVANKGDEFVPPVWMQNEWLELARAGRPFANLCNSMPLPPNTDSINIPKITGGTAAAIQTAENAAVSETDAATSSVSIGVKTISGQQDVSRQLLDRSQPGIDAVLFKDLAADYNTKLNVQCLNGSNASGQAKGILQDSNILSVTYTDGTPTVPELYPKIADAIQQIHTNRFQSPSVVVMAPRRWAWFLSALDSSNRPLVTPYAPQNSIAVLGEVAAQGVVGSLHGLPVVVDPSIPTTNGAGTNEDVVIVTRASDLYLFEDAAPQTRVFEEVLSGTLAIRLQLFGYFAFSSERYSKASAKISGTGLAAPTF